MTLLNETEDRKPLMTNPVDPKDQVTLEELSTSSMWEAAALVEVLEKKGKFQKGTGSARVTPEVIEPENPFTNVHNEHGVWYNN